MNFEFTAFAIIALVVIFVIERIYRKVLDTETKLKRQDARILIFEERLRKHGRAVRTLADSTILPANSKTATVEESISDDDMTRCPKCNRMYFADLPNCPYCKT